MGDRVAVLSAGLLQQVATPRELYDAPVNAFVAAFIGSPSMNIQECQIVDGGVRFGDATVPVERDILAKAGNATSVLLGVRPEDLHLTDSGATMRVTLVEELGADAYVYGEATAADGTPISLTARAGGQSGTRIGDTVHVTPSRVHVFSTEGDKLRIS